MGKTTLARMITQTYPQALMLNHQLPADRVKLANLDVFLHNHRRQLVVLDEVKYTLEIFAQLRPEIDHDRRSGRFLLLGSASGKLMAQSSEYLTSRVAYLELTPPLASELQSTPAQRADSPAGVESALLLLHGFMIAQLSFELNRRQAGTVLHVVQRICSNFFTPRAVEV